MFGTYKTYDEHGRKISESRPGFFGGRNEYDKKGHKTGHTTQGFFGDYNLIQECL